MDQQNRQTTATAASLMMVLGKWMMIIHPRDRNSPDFIFHSPTDGARVIIFAVLSHLAEFQL